MSSAGGPSSGNSIGQVSIDVIANTKPYEAAIAGLQAGHGTGGGSIPGIVGPSYSPASTTFSGPNSAYTQSFLVNGGRGGGGSGGAGGPRGGGGRGKPTSAAGQLRKARFQTLGLLASLSAFGLALKKAAEGIIGFGNASKVFSDGLRAITDAVKVNTNVGISSTQQLELQNAEKIRKMREDADAKFRSYEEFTNNAAESLYHGRPTRMFYQSEALTAEKRAIDQAERTSVIQINALRYNEATKVNEQLEREKLLQTLEGEQKIAQERKNAVIDIQKKIDELKNNSDEEGSRKAKEKLYEEMRITKDIYDFRERMAKRELDLRIREIQLETNRQIFEQFSPRDITQQLETINTSILYLTAIARNLQ